MNDHLSTLLYVPMMALVLLAIDQGARLQVSEDLARAGAFRAARALVSSTDAEGRLEDGAMEHARAQAALALLPDSPRSGGGRAPGLAAAAQRLAQELGLRRVGSLGAAVPRTTLRAQVSGGGAWTELAEGDRLPSGGALRVEVAWIHPLRPDPAALLYHEATAMPGPNRTVRALSTLTLGGPP